MTDNQNENSDKKRFGSPHLDEALDSFKDGLKSLGLFCAEEAIPTAEKGVKEGLDSLEGLLSKARETMDEAFAKAKSEFENREDNQSDKSQD